VTTEKVWVVFRAREDGPEEVKRSILAVVQGPKVLAYKAAVDRLYKDCVQEHLTSLDSELVRRLHDALKREAWVDALTRIYLLVGYVAFIEEADVINDVQAPTIE
jgi:hypothetical protein